MFKQRKYQLHDFMISLQAFGPIIPIMKFSSDEEVVKLANDSNYGLGCAVFSRSQKRAAEIASQIHCGVAAINDFASTYMCQVKQYCWCFSCSLLSIMHAFTAKLCYEKM